jgi:DNA-binding CsgD family transcriptional regulator
MVEPARSVDARSLLSPRELTVLALTAEGYTNTRAADELGVSVHAVKFHLASIYRKLGVRNRTEAAAVFLRQGISNGTATEGN